MIAFIIVLIGILIVGCMLYLLVREADICKDFEEYLELKERVSNAEYQASVAASLNRLKNNK